MNLAKEAYTPETPVGRSPATPPLGRACRYRCRSLGAPRTDTCSCTRTFAFFGSINQDERRGPSAGKDRSRQRACASRYRMDGWMDGWITGGYCCVLWTRLAAVSHANGRCRWPRTPPEAGKQGSLEAETDPETGTPFHASAAAGKQERRREGKRREEPGQVGKANTFIVLQWLAVHEYSNGRCNARGGKTNEPHPFSLPRATWPQRIPSQPLRLRRP